MNIADYDIWCVDFETYYDDIFSLKHLDSLEYIADERFKVHMMGVAINDNEPFILCANELPEFLSQPRARPIALLCQNTQFDGMILSRHYGFHADAYLDTRAMAAGLWPHASSSLAAVAERLWPDAPNLRKGNELALSKGLRTLPGEVYDAVASYCLQDVRLTRAAFHTMRLHFPPQELDVIDIMTQWCVRPAFELDYDLMARYIPKLDSERRQLIAASNLWRFADKYNPDTKGRPQFVKEFVKELAKGAVRDDEREYWLSLKVLNSNKAFGQWFAQQKIPVPMKLSPDGRSIPAFAQNDPEFMAMAAKHPQYAAVWEARASAKSTQALSRANKFVRTALAYDGRIPVPLRYGAAHTGRAGGSDGINLQNLQRNADKRHPDGDLRPGALRRALLAPPGYSVLVADLSNIEARMLAWLAGHDTLLEIFADGGDPYAWMASKIYNRPVSKDTDPFGRNVGKVALLSLGYGAGVERFTQMLHSGPMGLPPIHFDDKSMYQRIVATYRRDNSHVVSLWNWGNIALTAMMQPNTSIEAKACRLEFERCVLPNGLSLQYPDLSSTLDGMQYTAKNSVKTKIYGAKFIENLTQALATCVIKEAMVRIESALKPLGGRTVLQVHDEIVAICPDAMAADGMTAMLDAMTERPTWCPDLPIAAEGGYAPNYSK